MVALCAALAAPAQAGPPATDAPPRAWLCVYVLGNELWAVQCRDALALTRQDTSRSAERDTVWQVPLWSPPSSTERVALLLRATLCGRNPRCEVELADDTLPVGPQARTGR